MMVSLRWMMVCVALWASVCASPALGSRNPLRKSDSGTTVRSRAASSSSAASASTAGAEGAPLVRGGDVLVSKNSTDPHAGTPEELEAFMADLLPQLKERTVLASVAEWAKATNITAENTAASSAARASLMGFVGEALLNYSSRWQGVDPDAVHSDVEREVYLLQVTTEVPPPGSVAKQLELASLISNMEGNYSTAEACERADGETKCRNLDRLEKQMGEFSDYDNLLEVWTAWRTATAGKIKPLFLRYRELANEGAKTIMYRDLAHMWQSAYDLNSDKFVEMVDRLYNKVKPLYEQLHCYVREKLHAKYGSKAPVGFDSFVPAHLLGDMWGQDWSNLWSRLQLQPFPNEPGIDVNDGLRKKFGEDPVGMVKSAEDFFVGLGFDRLPKTFWERSVFTQPEDRKMVCHASAWDVTYNDDVRLKACLHTTQSDYFTAHHELGHCYYFQSYYKRNVLFQNGANDGFHEAIGDTITLSLTPKYLRKVGLLDEKESHTEGALINNQLFRALDKVAFMPFAYMVDKWRYDVFTGRVREEKYNEHWWALRQKYQGIMSPVKRTSDDFDPGAKYHVAANVPYMRYFLASILQFQFHRALCAKANHTGPLHECSIAESKEAGKALKDMLSLGASRPWQEALKSLSGETEMDPSAIIDYFAPLLTWLTHQNKGRECGWPQSAPVQPVDPRSHLGIMIGLAAGAAVAIFIGAGAFNWWHSRRADIAYDKMPGRGDYDGM